MAHRLFRHIGGHFVAYLALFFALGGTSFAAVQALPKNSVGSAQIKNGAIQKVDISKRTVSALRGLRGPRGLQGVTGAQGPKGDTGATGVQGLKGDPGSAVAFARIAADGTLDTAHSKNITSASLSSITGVYCVTPSVPVTSLVVSVPHVGGDTGNFAQANIPANGDATTTACSTPAWVYMRNGSGANENHPFYLVFN